jgi:hypothetical protein
LERFKRKTRIHAPHTGLYAIKVSASERSLFPVVEPKPNRNSILYCQKTIQSRGPWLSSELCCLTGSIAYYGLIRNSQPLPSIYLLYDGSLPYGLVWAGIERLPNLLRMSLSSVPPSVPRWTKRSHMAVASPFIVAFAQSAEARHPQSHPRRFLRKKRNEAAKFALCYGPVELLALHRQGRLLSSFHLTESPH